MFKRSGLLALALMCGLASGQTQAQCGGAYGGGGFGYGYGFWDIGQLYRVLADNVPYYSAFPPVYYSVPVPRTYGYSPFAYPPGVMTPEVVETVAAEEIVNPYVEPASAKSETKEADKVTSVEKAAGALVISNPYVSNAVRTASIER